MPWMESGEHGDIGNVVCQVLRIGATNSLRRHKCSLVVRSIPSTQSADTNCTPVRFRP